MIVLAFLRNFGLQCHAVGNGIEAVDAVALTANAMKEDRDRCLESGMDDFLSKPLRKEKLIKTLEKFLLPM